MNSVLFKSCAAILGGLSLGTINLVGDTYAGHDYEVVLFQNSGDSYQSWDVANGAVPSGYHLATINSSGEEDFVKQLITSIASPSVGGGEYWLGGIQKPDSSDPTVNWTWITGETWGATYWNSGEPNHAGNPYPEDWLAIGWASERNWNDEGNFGNVSGYVIESTPDGGASLALMGVALMGLGVLRRKIS